MQYKAQSIVAGVLPRRITDQVPASKASTRAGILEKIQEKQRSHAEIETTLRAFCVSTVGPGIAFKSGPTGNAPGSSVGKTGMWQPRLEIIEKAMRCKPELPMAAITVTRGPTLAGKVNPLARALRAQRPNLGDNPVSIRHPPDTVGMQPKSSPRVQGARAGTNDKFRLRTKSRMITALGLTAMPPRKAAMSAAVKCGFRVQRVAYRENGPITSAASRTSRKPPATQPTEDSRSSPRRASRAVG
jgi:hypothetical protein